MSVQIVENMVWDCESDSTSAPDGVYKMRTDMFDYRAADNNEWPPKQDYVFLNWESDLPVSVTDGKINTGEALAAAGHLMYSCGYHGVYVEQLEFDPVSKTFDLTVGS
jgi:hypothetical protein